MPMSAELRALMDQKDDLERQIASISDALSAGNMGGVTGRLVDSEGFPRADIDVHQTRTLRHQLACLNTDHQSIMAQIEAAMHAHFAASGPARPQTIASRAACPATTAQPASPFNSATGAPTAPAAPAAPTANGLMEVMPSSSAAPTAVAANGHDTLVPFAEFDEVAEGGPAHSAGIHQGDKLLSFGGISAANHDQLRALARLTQRSVGRSISLLVLRTEGGQDDRLTIELYPRQWPGQGLLGCHLRPL